MKTFIILISILFSLQVLAAACKCNCDPADRSMCASYYDLDRPCSSICPGATPGMTPMITACPVQKRVNPMSQAIVWISNCPDR
jgi:hypothetical protein